MKIAKELTDEALLGKVGERLARLRLSRNLTQAQLAEQAGLGVRTVQRLELGATATQLSGFFRVCRVLGLLERIDALIPELTPSPIAQLKLQGRERRRASRQKAAPPPAGAGRKKWSWGDAS